MKQTTLRHLWTRLRHDYRAHAHSESISAWFPTRLPGQWPKEICIVADSEQDCLAC